jgi:hypothetical protein
MSSILGDFTLEQLPGKCSPSFTVLYYVVCLLALPAACVAGNCIELVWRQKKAGVKAKKADVAAKKASVELRRKMEASTKAKLHAHK